MLEATNIRQIDFLPAELRQARSQKRRRRSLIASSVVVLVVVLATAAVEGIRAYTLHGELAEAISHREAAQARAAELVQARERLMTMREKADVIALVHTRRPRSRLLQGLFAAMPPELVLTDVTIEESVVADTQDRFVEASIGEEDLAAQEKRASEKFVRDWRNTQTTILVSGETTQTQRLTDFLRAVRDIPCFDNVELRLLESRSQSEAGGNRFAFSVNVAPEAGRKHGPVGPQPGEPYLAIWAYVTESAELCVEAATDLPDGDKVRVEVFNISEAARDGRGSAAPGTIKAPLVEFGIPVKGKSASIRYPLRRVLGDRPVALQRLLIRVYREQLAENEAGKQPEETMTAEQTVFVPASWQVTADQGQGALGRRRQPDAVR
ncbi:MAG: hypothetical protein D6741_01415 [Planctomycetota bacterium]|nr:MAG: hypothetical protein D6741_01415 [Planctomycetota bacterium]